jgi:hypothetical protein
MWSIGLRERRARADGPRVPAVSRQPRPSLPVASQPDPRRLTPRQMADLGHRLYLTGLLGLDDSRLLSSPPELHPDYGTTVARLPGHRAAPDAPRDHLQDWKGRLAFALRYTPDEDERIDRIRRIVLALTRLAASPSPYCVRE